MKYLRIEEAKSYAKKIGRKVTNISLGKRMYNNPNKGTLNTNVSNLSNGRTKRIDINWVYEICDECGIDANFLFGIKPMDQEQQKKNNIIIK